MEFFRFILSGFWTWAGFLILVVAAGNAVAEIIKAIRKPIKVTAHNVGGRRIVQIEGAKPEDITELLNKTSSEGDKAARGAEVDA